MSSKRLQERPGFLDQLTWNERSDSWEPAEAMTSEQCRPCLTSNQRKEAQNPSSQRSRALNKETPDSSAPPAMGCSPVCCVALCLLAAGGSLAQERIRFPSLTLPETMAIIGFSPAFFLSPSFPPTGLVDAGVTQTPRCLIKARGQRVTLRCSPVSGHLSVYWYQQALG